jgi:hypothetical protein
MRRHVGWVLTAVALGCLALPLNSASAQIEANLGAYTGDNAEGYLKPLEEGLGAALNDGFFRTAHIAQSGFNFNFEVKTMFVKFSDDDRTFTAKTEPGFYPADDAVEAPTVIGDTLALVVPGNNGTAAVFPGGFDVGSLGIAVPQITVGSVKGTQAIFRYMAFDTGDVEIGDFSLMGFGLRHSLSQYFPDPPLELAVGGMYQAFDLGDDLVDATAVTFGVQGSKRLGVFEPYGGVGYDSFSMSVKYDEATNSENKIDLDFESENNVHLTGGLGINLSFLHLMGEVNVSSQTSYLLGVSLGN